MLFMASGLISFCFVPFEVYCIGSVSVYGLLGGDERTGRKGSASRSSSHGQNCL